MSPAPVLPNHFGGVIPRVPAMRTVSIVKVILIRVSRRKLVPISRIGLACTIPRVIYSNGCMTVITAIIMRRRPMAPFGKVVTVKSAWLEVALIAVRRVRCALKTGKNFRALVDNIMLASAWHVICKEPGPVGAICRLTGGCLDN